MRIGSWLASDASDGVTGKRITATEWSLADPKMEDAGYEQAPGRLVADLNDGRRSWIKRLFARTAPQSPKIPD
jgi:hypothetical protein